MNGGKRRVIEYRGVRCPKCGAWNPVGAMICSKCGAPL